MPDLRKTVCTKLTTKQSNIQQQKKGVFNAVGNLGQLDVLEEVGVVNNNTRKGLSAMAKASNILRSGAPSSDGIVKALGRTAIESTEAGADIVLDATGIGRVGLDMINAVDAGVANRALGAAKQVFKKSKQGEFTLLDVPGALSDIQNIESLLRGIYQGGNDSNQQLSRFKCRPSPFALDLVHRGPKMKFMYIVEIKFAGQYADLNRLAATMAFVTKSAGRPQVDFEYEEVNMYNYRTQVLKRTVLQPMQLRFIDDVQGNTIRFYEMYLKAMSPISNLDKDQLYTQVGDLERKGMNFDGANYVQYAERFPDQSVTDDPIPVSPWSNAEDFYQAKSSLEAKIKGVRNSITGLFSNRDTTLTAAYQETPPWYQQSNSPDRTIKHPNYAASAATPAGDNSSGDTIFHKQLLESITLHHVGDWGNSITSYKMINPRITSFQPDELTMSESGDGSELIFDFNYDALLISPNQLVADFGEMRLENLTGGNIGAMYPLRPVGYSEGTPMEGGGHNPNQATPLEVFKQAADVNGAFTSPTTRNQATKIPGSDVSATTERLTQDVYVGRTSPSVDRGDGSGTFFEAPAGDPY